MRRKRLACTTLVAAVLFLALSSARPPLGSTLGGVVKGQENSVIRAAPPAPVFTDEERIAELRARRARVAERMGPRSVLVMFSAEPRIYSNDVDYEFRQENNLYYLTGLNQEGSTLVMMPGHTGGLREILFLPRRNPAAEVWNGRMYSAEEARRISGVEVIWDAKEFEPFMRALRGRNLYRPQPEAVLLSTQEATQTPAPPATGYETLYAAMAEGDASLYLLLPTREESREFRQEQEFASRWARSASGLNVRSIWPVFARMRMTKSPYELKLLQHAVDITVEAHMRAQAAAPRAEWEYEVEAELDYTFRRRNADNWGYPSIVGCGPNATTLHYVESQGRVRPTDLILIDAGAEYGHYTADITRTFPAGGRFTPEQAQVYEIVLAAQAAGIRAVRPGASLADVHRAATDVIRDGLLRLGLITERDSRQYAVWFMHGTSHYLGMNVHDVSAPGVTRLEPGMVFTVEPGIYVRHDALENLPKTPENERFAAAVRTAFEKYKGIGVRIEDVILVTADGHKNLSAALPRAVKEIEGFMARAAKRPHS